MKIEDYKKMCPSIREYLKEYCEMKEREIRYWENNRFDLKPSQKFMIEIKKVRLEKAQKMVEQLTDPDRVWY